MFKRYPLSVVPPWCGMSTADHQDGMGGCWGISEGFVRDQGEPYCLTCEHYQPVAVDAPEIVEVPRG